MTNLTFSFKYKKANLCNNNNISNNKGNNNINNNITIATITTKIIRFYVCMHVLNACFKYSNHKKISTINFFLYSIPQFLTQIKNSICIELNSKIIEINPLFNFKN